MWDKKYSAYMNPKGVCRSYGEGSLICEIYCKRLVSKMTYCISAKIAKFARF